MEVHLSLQDLAALAEGQLQAERSARARRHLASCVQCLDAYTTAAEAYLHRWDDTDAAAPPPELDAAARQLAGHSPPPGALTAIRARGRMPRHGPWGSWWQLPAAWRTGSAAGLVALVAVATVLVRLAPRGAMDPTELSGVSLGPLQQALADMSTYSPGSLVLQGGEASADMVARAVERSGAVPRQPQVRRTLAQLEDLEAKGGLFSPRLAYWLGVGYLAEGDLTTARIHLDQALRRFPDQIQLLLLDADRANRSNELALAEQRLRQVLQRRPRDQLARLDLGILLARDPQRRAEASALLADAARGRNAALAGRAQRALQELAVSP